MTKVYRLSRADFLELSPFIKEQGKLFVLAVSKSPDTKPRFACVVSKKTARKAHERNQIKRRFRAALREVGLKGPFAFVFTAKRSAFGADYGAVLQDVHSLIVKVSPSLKGVAELQ
jgi:ribonuclease P protein component